MKWRALMRITVLVVALVMLAGCSDSGIELYVDNEEAAEEAIGGIDTLAPHNDLYQA